MPCVAANTGVPSGAKISMPSCCRPPERAAPGDVRLGEGGEVARRIRAGTFSVNGGVYYGGDAPFGGYKQSGIGREMGTAGFEEYLEMKTVAMPEI